MSNINNLQEINEELKNEEKRMLKIAYEMTAMICNRYQVCDKCPLKDDGPCVLDVLASAVIEEVKPEPWRL